MDKNVVITTVALVIIAITVGFSAWNVFAAEQLQFRGPEGEFSYFDMSNQGAIEVCNPLPFLTTFNQFAIVTFFEGKPEGTYSVSTMTIPSLTTTELNGKYRSDEFAQSQYHFLHFDSMFSGTSPVRIDPNKFAVGTEIQTSIIGVIPYSITKQYSGMQFWKMMNGEGEFDC